MSRKRCSYCGHINECDETEATCTNCGKPLVNPLHSDPFLLPPVKPVKGRDRE